MLRKELEAAKDRHAKEMEEVATRHAREKKGEEEEQADLRQDLQLQLMRARQ